MTYFIAWCVFLVVVILSVPIASMMEKRKHRAARGPADEPSDELVEGEAEEEAAAAEEEFGEPEEVAEFEDVP